MAPIVLWFDQLVMWVLSLGRCRAGEYLSSAAWSLEQDGKWAGRVFRPFIDWLFSRWESDHCRKSWLGQQHLYQDPPHE